LKKNSNGEVKWKVLVHCHAGVSRSSTIVISYLMRKYINFSLNDALKFVKSKRPIIKPNKGFMKQLQKYEDKLKKDYLESDLKTPFTKRIRKDQIVDWNKAVS
jgi:protein-tyrosine phosphatase